MGVLESFCRGVRARSDEHRRATALLPVMEFPGQHVAMLRQELDSLIRVFYLLTVSDLAYREELMQATAEGRRWKAQDGRFITDAQMVRKLSGRDGWAKLVYDVGCRLIHLSNLHDYQARDPLKFIPAQEKVEILRYLRQYHGGPAESDPRYVDLLPYIPKVFEKIAANLEYYVRELEAGKTIR